MKNYRIILLIALSLTSFSSFSQSLTNKSTEELELMKKEAISTENYDLANKISEEQKTRVSLDDKLIELDKNLKAAVAKENFDEAEKIKKEIKSIEEKKVTIKKLEEEKKAAILTEDFDKVIALDKQINELKSGKKPVEEKPIPPAPVKSSVNNTTTNQSLRNDNGMSNVMGGLMSANQPTQKGMTNNTKKKSAGGTVAAIILIPALAVLLLLLLLD